MDISRNHSFAKLLFETKYHLLFTKHEQVGPTNFSDLKLSINIWDECEYESHLDLNDTYENNWWAWPNNKR